MNSGNGLPTMVQNGRKSICDDGFVCGAMYGGKLALKAMSLNNADGFLSASFDGIGEVPAF